MVSVAQAAQFVHDFHVDTDTSTGGVRVLVDNPCGNDDGRAQGRSAASETQGTDGAFERLFAPWPLRFYVAERGRLAFIAEPRECTYDLSLLREHLLRTLVHS